jgi:hypothetical protein
MADEEHTGHQPEAIMDIRVSVDTAVESYPVLGIWPDEAGHPIPAEMWTNLQAARDAVEAAEVAIMGHLAAAHPDVEVFAEWAKDRRNDARHAAARARYESDHPDGPEWMRSGDAVRQRYLDETGYER